MVEKGLGVTTLFGDKWRIDHEKAQLIQTYDEQGNKVSRKVWMMLSDRCFQRHSRMEYHRGKNREYTFDKKLCYYGVTEERPATSKRRESKRRKKLCIMLM